MKHLVRRCWLLTVTAGVLVGFGLLPGTTAQGQELGANVVTMQMVGNPQWLPVDVHLFTAPIGTAADNYAEFGAQGPILLPPPHYKFYPSVGMGPGTPEKRPYNHDLADGVKDAGYTQGRVFTKGQFSNGNGVYFVYMVVPKLGTKNAGSSPDFSDGPIIPNSLFPITFSGVTNRDGTISDPQLVPPTVVPPLNSLAFTNPPFDVDGFSHFPIFIADNADFQLMPHNLPGQYSYVIHMLDVSGNGWTITVNFTIV
jgi:hypothetical protein